MKSFERRYYTNEQSRAHDVRKFMTSLKTFRNNSETENNSLYFYDFILQKNRNFFSIFILFLNKLTAVIGGGVLPCGTRNNV